MKELRSRKHPHKMTQIVTDEEYEMMLSKGIARRFTVKDIMPVRNIIPTPRIERPVIDVKKTKKKT